MHRRIAVIGAGPYGLAIAAKLHAARADFVVFGRVMAFWRESVPKGSFLLSNSFGCSLSSALSELDYGAYQRSLGHLLPQPVSAEQFSAYGSWFQKQTCPDPDGRDVVKVAKRSGVFSILLNDGEEITCDHVILAVGMKPFAFRPPPFAGLFSRRVSHTSDLHELSSFRGKNVAVIGGGQSAVESAALLAAEGADVELFVRAHHLPQTADVGLHDASAPARRSFRSHVTGYLNRPDIFCRLPAQARKYWLARALRPALATQLIPMLDPVRFALGRSVTAVDAQKDFIDLRVDDGSTRRVDHIVLGAGYRVAVAALPFLSPELRTDIRHHRGYPELDAKMQTTVPNLFFTGAASAWNFGPLMWFVRGAPWAADRVSRAVLSKQDRFRRLKLPQMQPDAPGTVLRS